MKLDELEQEMMMAVASKIPPAGPRLVKGNKTSGGPAGVETVLEGEVLGPEPEEEESYDELGYACNLLTRISQLLAFLGDPKLTGNVQPEDRTEIGHFIDEIQDFMDWVEEEAEEDEQLLYCSQCEFKILNTSTETRNCPDCRNHPDLMTEEELSEEMDDELAGPFGDPAYQTESHVPDPDSDIPDMNVGGCKNLLHSSCVMSIADTKLWCSPCKAWYAAFYYEGSHDGVLADDGDLTPQDLARLNGMVSSMSVDV